MRTHLSAHDVHGDTRVREIERERERERERDCARACVRTRAGGRALHRPAIVCVRARVLVASRGVAVAPAVDGVRGARPVRMEVWAALAKSVVASPARKEPKVKRPG